MSDYYLGSMPLLVQEQLKEIRMAGYSVTIKSLDNIDEWLVEVRGRRTIINSGYRLTIAVHKIHQLLYEEIMI